MVSSSVRAMNLVNNQTVSSKRELSVEGTSNDFAKMMDESINKSKNSDVKDDVKTDIKSSTVDEKKSESVSTDEKVNSDEQVTEGDKTSDEEITEDTSKEISEEVSEEIMSQVSAILNISVEELKAALEELGIEGKDLLDLENVTKLVMDLKNIESKMDLLVHEDANDTIKDIQKSIEELLEDLTNESQKGNESENILLNQNGSTISESEQHSQFANNGESDKEMSKGENNDSILNNSLNEVVDNILNEVEMALEERIDETMATRIVRQIADNISLAIRDRMTSLEMQLNPESLGKVTVLLATEEGGITAKITAETEMAKNAIEQQLTILKENFEKQGLKVTDIEVTIASHGFEQNLDKNDSKNQEQQKKSNGIRKGLLDEINGISSEDEPKEREEVMKQALGSTVSYLA